MKPCSKEVHALSTVYGWKVCPFCDANLEESVMKTTKRTTAPRPKPSRLSDTIDERIDTMIRCYYNKEELLREIMHMIPEREQRAVLSNFGY